jgi:hypothetical protein
MKHSIQLVFITYVLGGLASCALTPQDLSKNERIHRLLNIRVLTSESLRLYELAPSKRNSPGITHSIDSITVGNDPSERFIGIVPSGSAVKFDHAFAQRGSGDTWAWLEGMLSHQGSIYRVQYYMGFPDMENPNGWGRVYRYFRFPKPQER